MPLLKIFNISERTGMSVVLCSIEFAMRTRSQRLYKEVQSLACLRLICARASYLHRLFSKALILFSAANNIYVAFANSPQRTSRAPTLRASALPISKKQTANLFLKVFLLFNSSSTYAVSKNNPTKNLYSKIFVIAASISGIIIHYKLFSGGILMNTYKLVVQTIQNGKIAGNASLSVGANSTMEARQKFMASHPPTATKKYKIIACAKQ